MTDEGANSKAIEDAGYRAIRLLGSGGWGVVFEAIHVASRERVAIKMPREDYARDPEVRERLRAEAEIPAYIDHPNVIKVHDFVYQTTPFYVMELLVGRSLYDLAATPGALALAPDLAVAITIQGLMALSATHRAGVVHRDVKLDNLFLSKAVDSDETLVKLIDFGIAKLLPDTLARAGVRPRQYPTRNGVFLGTPRYAAPEQVSGHPVDPRTDLYSMGVVLYRLLAGRGPFDEIRGGSEVCQAHLMLRPQPPSRVAKSPIPAELDELVMHALEKRQEDRLDSADDFAQALIDIHARMASPVGWLRTQSFDQQSLCAAIEAPKLREAVQEVLLPESPKPEKREPPRTVAEVQRRKARRRRHRVRSIVLQVIITIALAAVVAAILIFVVRYR